MNKTDRLSLIILGLAILTIVYVLAKFSPGSKPFYIVSLIGSVASTGGLMIAIVQIIELRKSTEASTIAILTTEKELSITRAIESATNCFNQMNQIDEYLETNNFDSIKTLLPIATKNFHEMVFYSDFNLESLMTIKSSLVEFLEAFAGDLTIITNHRNMRKLEYELTDEELKNITSHIQKIKAFSNEYKTSLQSAIVKDGSIKI